MVKIQILFFGALTHATGEKAVDVVASTLLDAFNQLAVRYGDVFKERVYDETGKLRRFINIYVNGRDIRYLERLNTRLKPGDTVSIMPAVSGG